MKKLFILALFLFSLSLSPDLLAQQPGKTTPARQTTVSARKMTEEQKISHLIEYVRNLEGATFIRNGSEYSAKKAAEHLQMKRDKAGDRVKTARDFIDGLASESYLSGKKYQIRLKNGKVLFSRDVLMSELARLEAGR